MFEQLYSYITRPYVLMVFVILSTVNAYGQKEETTTSMQAPSQESAKVEVLAELDTVKKKRFLSGFEIMVDYGKLLTLWTEFESKYEAGFNLRFKERIVLVTEFGMQDLNPLKAYDNAIYYNINGQYARIGIDYYTSYDPNNFYFFGIRYGSSLFDDKGAFLIQSEYFEDFEEVFGSKDVTANWFEFVVGTETFLSRGKRKQDPKSRLILGWNGSLRILTDFTNREEPRIYAIPGYGRTFNNAVVALNLYIKYRFGR